MLKLILGGLIKTHGVLGVLVVIGDLAVKITKSKKDDKLWNKIKRVIQASND